MPIVFQILIPSTAKRKRLWRTLEKQQFLLLQEPHGDLWGEGMWLWPGREPGQEDNRVLVSAYVNKWLSWYDWRSVVPPLYLFYLALHGSWRGARMTTDGLSGTIWLSEVGQRGRRGHFLILGVLTITEAPAVWGSADERHHPPAIPSLHDCCVSPRGNIYRALTRPRPSAKSFCYLSGSKWTYCQSGGQKKMWLFSIIYLLSFPGPISKNSTKSSLVIEIHLSCFET